MEGPHNAELTAC